MAYIPKHIKNLESQLEEKLRLAQMIGDRKTIDDINVKLSNVYLAVENRISGGLEL